MLTYPKILTNKDWQKNKGLIAKAKKTGLGPELDALEAAYKKVDQGKLTAKGYGKLHNDAEVDDAFRQAKQYYTKNVEPLRAQAKRVRDLARQIEAEYKKSKTVPKSSRVHVGKIAAEADRFMVQLKGFEDEYATFAEYKATLAAQIDMSRKKIVDDMKRLDDGIEKFLKICKKDPTGGYEAWKDNVHQRCRSICNGIKVVPEWNDAYWKTWQPWGDMFHERSRKKAKSDPAEETRLIMAGCMTLMDDLADLRADLVP